MHELMNMVLDRDNLFKLGLTACALGISFFILWGPKLGSRRGVNNGALIGLQNLGLTCFLNSLLQALASCPYFIEWLEAYRGAGKVTDALLSVLKLLCYERTEDCDIDEGTYSPRELISALSQHGWSIAPQEQDAHELFLLLVTTLEEEEKASNKNKGSLSDALESFVGNEPLNDFTEVTSHGDVTQTQLPGPPPKHTTAGFGDLKRPNAPPFRGFLTSQLQCMSCNYKSALRYDKFDTLSLHLPPTGGDVSLRSLLEGFVRTEILEDFVCDACNKSKPPNVPSITSKAIKTVNIGKLPKCLCLHISRTYMTQEGVVYKRDNYVDFPEFLSMNSYTHNTMLREMKMKEHLYGLSGTKTEKSEMDNESLVNKVVKNGCIDVPSHLNNNFNLNSPPRGLNGISGNHLYRLKAVVEHKGSVDNGHFVTYRRGPLHSASRHRCNDSHDTRKSSTSSACAEEN